MTKSQLIQAQALFTIFESANRILDTRLKTKELTRDSRQILSHAAHAFVCLTGRMPSEVSRVELNTDSPATWTNEVGR